MEHRLLFVLSKWFFFYSIIDPLYLFYQKSIFFIEFLLSSFCLCGQIIDRLLFILSKNFFFFYYQSIDFLLFFSIKILAVLCLFYQTIDSFLSNYFWFSGQNIDPVLFYPNGYFQINDVLFYYRPKYRHSTYFCLFYQIIDFILFVLSKHRLSLFYFTKFLRLMTAPVFFFAIFANDQWIWKLYVII